MRKLLFITFSLICMIFNAGTVFAQGRALSLGIKAGEAAAKSSSAALRRMSAASTRVPAVSSRLQVPVSVSVPIRPHILSKGKYSVTQGTELRIRQLEQSVQLLQQENLQLKATLNNIGSNPSLRRATFQAAATTDAPTNLFSGTVFKTVYNGEEEIYGVVAAHAIAVSSWDKALNRHFTAGVFDGEKMVKVPAEIVQLSSPSMLDIALVKFSPEAEKMFQPLRISEVPVKFGDVLSSQGFAGGTDVHLPNREITNVTPLSVRTTIPLAREERPGLCGSAVVNADHELVGIHTGSVYNCQGAQFDVGYATNASFLNILVEAYHNGGEATFPLILNGKNIIPLNVDEYISYVSFQNAEGKQIWQKGFDSKFSYSKVQEMLEEYSPRYITVTVRRAVWSPTNPEVLVENRTSRELTKTTYKYDFETEEIISVTKTKQGRQ
ncbi:MAG: hypothetical protein ACI351_07090 [Candidatus Avelusimicrobium sp.]|uniref:hypothetical protein n=1 Tax=Candidatus Avelusimicrobium sp. TaxID=3048833 RepID=UPI003F05467F